MRGFLSQPLIIYKFDYYFKLKKNNMLCFHYKTHPENNEQVKYNCCNILFNRLCDYINNHGLLVLLCWVLSILIMAIIFSTYGKYE